MAQQGRQRANAEIETQVKTLELEAKNKMIKEQVEQAAEQRITNISQQAEALAKFYRPADLEKMQVVESDAKAKLQEQLNMYNDDINAFMRGGGRQAINDYREAILGSDEAQIIRNNHQSLLKYMDQSDEDATLISDRDRENYQRWKSGELDSFIWNGAYSKLDEPTPKELENAPSIAEAYLNKNYDKVLTNYLIDTGIDFGVDGRAPEEYYQELLVYQNSQLGPAEIEAARNSMPQVQANKKSYSSNMQSVFDSMNGDYQGNFDHFFTGDAANYSALANLEQIAWIQPYNVEDGGTNKRLYGQRMFVGQDLDIAKEFFPEMENGVVAFDDLRAHQSNLGAGGVYDEDGTLISPGSKASNDPWYNPNDDWSVHGVELMFEVNLPDGEKKLMTIKDLREGSALRDLKKNAVMVMSFSEGDGMGNPDDFRYMKLDLNNPIVSQKVDKSLGKLEYSVTENLKNTPGNLVNPYRYTPGQTFKYLPDNVNSLVGSLNAPVEKVFTSHNHTEYDFNAKSLLMATAMMNHESNNPYVVLNEFATSQDPEEKQLISALKNSDYDEYFNLLSSYGASEQELRELYAANERIKMGYILYGDRKMDQ